MSANKIVLAFRLSRAAFTSGEGGYLERARGLTQRAEAYGATMVGWSAFTVSFALDADSIEEAISLAVGARENSAEGIHAWQCGVAEGPMEALSPYAPRDDFAWGPPLVTAVGLARVAEPGEVLVDARVVALQTGELLVVGRRFAPVAGRRVRGERLDVREPWKSTAAANVQRLTPPPFVGREGVVDALCAQAGVLAVLRADKGMGGSRILQEIASRRSPERTVLLSPSGLGAEPLGSLRQTLLRSRHPSGSASVPGRASLESARVHLLAGEGVSPDDARSLLYDRLGYDDVGSDEGCALLLDDADGIDPDTLEACRDVLLGCPKLVCVVHVPGDAEVPQALASLPMGPQWVLGPLDPIEGEAMARGCVGASAGGALHPGAASRWSRRGGGQPLAIFEAVACGLATGELAWIDGEVFARGVRGGRGKAHPASFWIAQRLAELTEKGRAALLASALHGGDVAREMLADTVAIAGSNEDEGTPETAEALIDALVRTHWLEEPERGFVCLRSRSAKEAILALVDEDSSRAWHRAVAATVGRHTGPLVRAEAAQHAAKAAESTLAARFALEAARTANNVGLQRSALALLAFARAEDLRVGRKSVSLRPDPARSSPCRTSLTRAVDFAQKGLPDDAVVEALSALARARDTQDAVGERATLRLLDRLFESVGQPFGY